MLIEESDYLAHYGILRKSGRYPWGSGPDPVSRSKDFKAWIKDMRAQGVKESEIAKGVGLTINDIRALDSIATNEIKQSNVTQAIRLKEKQMSNTAIAQKLGVSEGAVRSWLSENQKEKADMLKNTVDVLKKEVDERKYVDVGSGTENFLNVSRTRLDTAIGVLKAQGYVVHRLALPQLGTGENTQYKVLASPGVKQKEVFLNYDKIVVPTHHTKDNGRTFFNTQPPLSIDPSRVKVRYKEDGGADADGVVYVRPGVKDVSLGKSTYSQVRILVGDKHYIKGMAIYKDDLPKGVDLEFNTNKSDTGNKLDALKKIDPKTSTKNNPFGSQIKAGGQIIELDSKGKARVTSVMNKVNDQGDWYNWRRNLPSQLLSKQSPTLAKEQLDKQRDKRQKEFDEIMALTNPTVKKEALKKFAEAVDGDAVTLAAHAMPRQATHVLFPFKSIKENQVYAPNYNDGETVVLVRFPHAGRFEIPELTVNNKNREAKKLLGQAADAIGIHPKVAEKLSGADFDGDTVLVIPNNNKKFKSQPALEGLKDFDPRATYKGYPGMPKMSSDTKGIEMGKVSNLITDMTLQRASADKMARAVRHSMVVIDAEKHNLNYRQSAIDNGIPQLMKEFQGRSGGGASTLISRAKSPIDIPDRRPSWSKEGGPVNKKTGELQFTETGKTRKLKDGRVVPKTKEVKLLSVTKDARTLSSGTRIEAIYADHSNALKDMANKARLADLDTPPLKYSPSAKKAYSKEVASLDAKYQLVVRNRPLERNAQIIGTSIYRAKKADTPGLDKDALKKIKGQSLDEARLRVGASRSVVDFSPSEWAAVQAGAISNSRLEQLLRKADDDKVRELSSPKTKPLMTPNATTKAKRMLSSGATRAEVALSLGVSLATLDRALADTA
jgi:hypothetical protein